MPRSRPSPHERRAAGVLRTFALFTTSLAAACAQSDPATTSGGATTTGGPAGSGDSGEGTAAATVTSATSEATSSGAATSGADSTGGGAVIEPGPDTSVVAFEGEPVFWLGWDEGQNRREVDVEVEFPDAALAYTAATLQFALSCPDDACDWWDRKGSIGIVEDAGTDAERVLEIARFVTPYRVGGTWELDVTALRPLLSGPRTLRVYIDTWVGPGHANGNGWLVDARFDLVGGIPSERPIAVLPLFPLVEVGVGDPMVPIADQIAAVEAMIPAGASRVELRSVITGHGQGNADNCAEFCPLAHGYEVGGAGVQRTIWRDDCGDNPISNQQGTWQLPRAGWCPGDIVQPWVEDVTAMVTAGASVSVRYDTQGYENTCRPDAPVCTGCTLGTGCEYDGGNHTPPTMLMSALMIAYEQVES